MLEWTSKRSTSTDFIKYFLQFFWWTTYYYHREYNYLVLKFTDLIICTYLRNNMHKEIAFTYVWVADIKFTYK